MVEIDERFDLLKASQKAGWHEIPRRAEQIPAQAATILWEQMRELARSTEVQNRDADFRTRLATAERAAASLREILRGPIDNRPEADRAFQQVGQSCLDCHKAHRN